MTHIHTRSTIVPLGFADENFTVYSNLSFDGNLNETSFGWNVTSLSPSDRKENLSLTQMILIAIVAGSLSIATVAGNIMVMVSFKIDKQLQTISNYFLFSLAVADFTIGLISMPLFTVYTIMGYWPFGAQICDLWLALDYLASNASVLNLLIISFDRYFSVTKPLTYRAKRSPFKAVGMIVSAWFVSLLLWPPWIYAWPYIEGRRTVPDDDCYIQFIKSNQYITFGTAIAAFYIPVSVMVFLYWRIWQETEKRQKELPHLQPITRHLDNSKRSTSSDEQTAVTEFDSWGRVRTSSNTISADCDLAVMDTSFSTKGVNSLHQQNNRLHQRVNTRRSTWLWLREWCIAWWHSGHEDYELDESYWEDGLSEVCVGTPLSGDTSRCTSFIKETSSGISQSKIQNSRAEAQRNRFVSSRSLSSDSVYTILIRLPAADPEGAGVEGPTIKMIPEQFSKTAPAALTSRRSEFVTSNAVPINRRPSNIADVRMPLNPQVISKQLEGKSKCIPPIKSKAAKKKKKPTEKKADKKAAKTLSAILLAFIVTWLPYNILVLLKPITASQFVSEDMWNFFYWLCYINSTINPLCYALCNASFRRTYMRILSCSWKRTHTMAVRGFYA